MEEMKARIRQTIVKALRLAAPLDGLGDDDDLCDYLGVDSVGLLEIFLALEEEFDVQIQGAMVTRRAVGTVNNLAELVYTTVSS
jgi:acyl carrier protein